MPRFTLILLSGIALGWVGCAHVSEHAKPPPPVPWAHEGSDLKPDPAVVWGRLDNGFRYAILPHGTPSQRVSLHWVVQVGGFHENERESGYAHFVEHMAFRELRDFPGTTASETLQKLGASPDSNAATSVFETRYYFPDLPTDDPTVMATALQVIRSMADGIIFERTVVDRERGVIFSELRSRAGMPGHSRADELEYLAPRSVTLRGPELEVLFAGTPIENGALGTEKTLNKATANRLRAFYQQWYRPERMILAVVGDIEPDKVERLIREQFSTLVGHGRPPAELPIPAAANPGRLVLKDRPGEPSPSLSMGVVRETDGRDNAETRKRSLAHRLALQMLSRRLERVVNSEDSPLLDADAFSSHYVPLREVILLRLGSQLSEWKKAFLAADFEVARLNKEDFLSAEIKLAIEREKRRTDAEARNAAIRPSPDLAAALAVSIARGIVFTTADDDRQLTAQQLAQLNAKDYHEAFREMFWKDEWSMAMTGDLAPLGTAKINVDFKESRATPFPAYSPPAEPRPFPFTDFGRPSAVVANDYDATTEAHLIRFENGVRLNLKPNRLEPGRVRFSLQMAGGQLAETATQLGLAWRTFAWVYGGLEGLPYEELSDMWAERIDNAGFSVTATFYRSVASCSEEDLPLLFQSGAALFVRPDFKGLPVRYSVQIFERATANLLHTANGAALVGTWAHMTGNHPSYILSSVEEVGKRTLDELKAWMAPQLASAPLEVTVVGDFDAKNAIALCARTFGALPVRAEVDLLADRRRAAFPPAPYTASIKFKGSKGVAAVALAWPAAEALNYPERFRVQILASILENRVVQKLRFERGETYSPWVAFTSDERLVPPIGFITCQIEADPEHTAQVASAAREVVAALARDGATPEELERARQPLLRQAEQYLHQNGWWLETLSSAQSLPTYCSGQVHAVEGYRSVRLDEINAAARRYLSTDRLGQLIALPE